MSTITAPRRNEIVYPESDGQPMAENTLQFRWIVTIQAGLDDLFRDHPNVFVAGDLLWYPVEGDNRLRQAPDAMVVFGRPKGDRGSYRQWNEEGIAPQVVFEVLSPGNRFGEMLRKLRFYEQYGVEEYYLYDPEDGDFSAWIADNGVLKEVETPIGWTSPLLGCRFEMDGVDLRIIRPDGRSFASYLEVCEQREAERLRADLESRRADEESRRADEEAHRADEESRRADEEHAKVSRLLLQLQAAGISPEL